MQGGLVHQVAGQERLTAWQMPDGHAFEPRRPAVAQVTLDPDVVDVLVQSVPPWCGLMGT